MSFLSFFMPKEDPVPITALCDYCRVNTGTFLQHIAWSTYYRCSECKLIAEADEIAYKQILLEQHKERLERARKIIAEHQKSSGE